MAVASGGVTEVAGPLIDAAAEAASKEIETAAEAFWAREDGRRAAMEQLRTALIDLTMVETDGGAGPIPLVVVVDELDRCRPDYALALLEVVKHFFSVPNVHFVLVLILKPWHTAYALGTAPVLMLSGTCVDSCRFLFSCQTR